MIFKAIKCTACGSVGQIYESPRFKSVRLCHTCLRKSNRVLTQLLGEDFIASVLCSNQPHLLHWLAIDRTFLFDSNRAQLVTPWFDNAADSTKSTPASD